MREYMRKLLAAGLIAVMVFAFAGCTGPDEDKSAEPTAEPTTEATEATETTAAPESDYDILEGSELVESGSMLLLYGNDFMLVMPNNDKWGYEKDSAGNLEIYLKAAREDDYGGNLVTIMAFDPDDTSYEDFPDYSVAGQGQNVNKTFVALFPTDVQFNPDDPEQAADYQELFDHVKKIAEGMVDSPFQTSDSDSEPQ